VDNKVILSVGVFLGVAIAAAGWMMTASVDPAAPPSAASQAEADQSEDRREKLLGGRELVKRQNTEKIKRVLGADGRSLAEEQAQKLPSAEADLPPQRFGVDETGVQQALDAKLDDLRACHRTARFHTPGLESSLELSLQLQPVPDQDFAIVSAVQSSSTFDAPVFEQCLSEVVDNVRFETTEATTLTWSVPFADEG
jgi:hypothetical protein